MKIFAENFEIVKNLKKRVSFKVQLNFSADLSKSEFYTKYAGDSKPVEEISGYYEKSEFENNLSFSEIDQKIDENLGEEIDWVKRGAVANVQHQGACNAGFLFA